MGIGINNGTYTNTKLLEKGVSKLKKEESIFIYIWKKIWLLILPLKLEREEQQRPTCAHDEEKDHDQVVWWRCLQSTKSVNVQGQQQFGLHSVPTQNDNLTQYVLYAYERLDSQ